MQKLHPKIQEVLAINGHGTVTDGAFATVFVDSSSESLDIKGADLSSLNEDGILNTEHVKPEEKKGEEGKSTKGYWGTVIGRVIFAKKIFKEEDCESQRELELWEQLGGAFIYGACELFDSEGHEEAKSAAAIINHYHKRGLPVVIRYSIEGSVLERKGNHLTKTIARRVAATIKPCNRSAYNSLVAMADEPAAVGEHIGKSEKHISTFEMEYAPIIEDPVEMLFNALSQIKEINKALTLGGGNVAPSALVGGAALAKEDVGKMVYLKHQVKAAIRDWDKKTPFKEFLKARMPDVDDSFIDKFAGITEDLKLQKAAQPEEYPEFKPLHSLDTKLPAGTKQFRGKHVTPGEIELIAGPYKGSKLKLLCVDDKYIYVVPFKAGDGNEVKVNKISRDLENKHYIIVKEPESLSLPNYLHGDKHADKDLTQFQEQKELLHGIDLGSDPLNKPIGSTQSRIDENMSHGWFKSSTGQTGYIKPSVVYESEELNPKDPSYVSTARREVIFHNIAKKFWGLGEFVPTTAMFKHPETGHEHSIMEIKTGASHVHPKSNSHESADALVSLGKAGILDKLAIMDIVMGNSDRTRLNYLLDYDGSKIHLIDNALIFNYGYEHIPAYLHDYHDFAQDNLVDAPLAPGVTHWLLSLNPFGLQEQLLRNRIDVTIVAKAVGRLLSMQSEAILGKNRKGDILLAHQKYGFEPVQQEIA